MRFTRSARSIGTVSALLPGSLMLGLTACSNGNPPTPHNGTGTIVGEAPLCYGPGPDTNLHPNLTIRAVRADGVAREIHVRVSNGHAGYRMTLPVGTYTISAYAGHVTAVVQANKTTTHVDLPQPGCF